MLFQDIKRAEKKTTSCKRATFYLCLEGYNNSHSAFIEGILLLKTSTFPTNKKSFRNKIYWTARAFT
jgi:hypothetical protein